MQKLVSAFQTKFSKDHITSFSVISGAALLLLSAYINGFPIVYSDTSTYLASGFEFEIPFDRPMTYGLFLWLTSLGGVSLWLVIFSQALILSFLIFQLLRISLPEGLNHSAIFLLIITFLSIFTSVSWVTSQLICDIFTPIMLLAFIILVIGRSSKWTRGILYFIFLIATTMHMSHITFNIFLILLILIIRKLRVFGIQDTLRLKPLLICLFVSVLSLATMGSPLSKSKHGFLMGAFVEHGIAKAYLDENCEGNNFDFCTYKDSLPDKAWVFLWHEDSPFYKMGGWKGTKTEFNEIIYNTLTTPKYIILHIKESIKATVDQLSKFNTGDGNGAFTEGTLLHKRIGLYFNHAMTSYESSLQQNNKFNYLHWYNKILFGVVFVSLLGLLAVIMNSRKLDKKILSIILLVISGILINAWVCGTLAGVTSRLGSKLIWLIPLITLIGAIHIQGAKMVEARQDSNND